LTHDKGLEVEVDEEQDATTEHQHHGIIGTTTTTTGIERILLVPVITNRGQQQDVIAISSVMGPLAAMEEKVVATAKAASLVECDNRLTFWSM